MNKDDLDLLTDTFRARSEAFVVQTGITRNSVTIAVWRLKRLGLLERTGEEPATTKPRALYAAT